ncbi:NAD(P)/FAD-dependent oxidoreductase [Streptomyces chitinivorans]|uniref:NAD(P)/FAD-dependent oxidoreductase n=1 Tax=Streptomyces chitinivorans TaxID=1257027 RepID=A0ABW7HTC6_9ACTN|nr:FAD-dependent oxidoreductase [Streptomyces chitinivorans]MDH2407285.1 FAD-dependent oxidoreductase [Streptomyces chitinivorans]
MSAHPGPRHIVVVGASLAGTATARALRERGYDGRVTLVGDEPHPPYDRPPLSKQLLAGEREIGDIALPSTDGLDVELRTGAAATALHPAERTLVLADGGRLEWDALVIATGAAARPWPAPVPGGVHTLRTLDDARALRRELAAEDARLLVVGAGFLGSEAAATAAELGVPVTLVEAGEAPMARGVGTVAGGFVARLHREAGVDLRTGTTVRSFTGTGRVTGAHLDDGAHVPATVVLPALGDVPNTAWLRGSGLLLDGAVVCDEYGRALAEDGTAVPGVLAVGDASRRPHPLVEGTLHLGHWSAAVEHAAVAARVLLHPAGDGELPRLPAAVPSFWSDQYGVRFRSLGLPHLADETRTVEYDVPGRRLEVTYHRGGELVGVLTANRTRRLAAHRPRLAEVFGRRRAAAAAL